MTGDDWSRQLPITRNEGVPGSSPGVGSCHLQGKTVGLTALGPDFLEHIPANACSIAQESAHLHAFLCLKGWKRLLGVDEGLLR
jgi:hypothetical protein